MGLVIGNIALAVLFVLGIGLVVAGGIQSTARRLAAAARQRSGSAQNRPYHRTLGMG
jgi:hypothetical protein